MNSIARPPAGRQSLVDVEQHFRELHEPAHGTVLIWERKAGRHSRRWHKIAAGDPLFGGRFEGQEDVFLSVNQFNGWRNVRLLKSLRAVYVDIDGTHDLEAVLDDLMPMPEPSLVVFSGRGLHLYWLLEPEGPKALGLWQRVQNGLVRHLRAAGADTAARDCSRVLRLCGTVNSKSQSEVHGRIWSGRRWKLSELAEEVLDEGSAEVRSLAVARARQRGLRPATGSIYQRWNLVYRDLQTIREAYWWGGIPAGHRDKWLFLSAVSLSWFAEAPTLRDELARVARHDVPTLQMREALAAIRPVVERADAAAQGHMHQFQGQDVDPRYRFRRSTLWEWMGDLVESKGLTETMRAIIPDELAAKRKAERDSARWSESRESYLARVTKEDLRTRVLELRQKGLKQREIAEIVGIKQPRVSLILKNITGSRLV